MILGVILPPRLQPRNDCNDCNPTTIATPQRLQPRNTCNPATIATLQPRNDCNPTTTATPQRLQPCNTCNDCNPATTATLQRLQHLQRLQPCNDCNPATTATPQQLQLFSLPQNELAYSDYFAATRNPQPATRNFPTMYRFLLLLGVIISSIICLYLGAAWYAPGIMAAALAVLLPVWKRGGFWFAFLGGLMVWGFYAGYLHWENQGRLSDRLAVTFGLANGWALVGVTALIGGMTTGLGGWLGASLRRAFISEKTTTV
jgi:hypothetical protein